MTQWSLSEARGSVDGWYRIRSAQVRGLARKTARQSVCDLEAAETETGATDWHGRHGDAVLLLWCAVYCVLWCAVCCALRCCGCTSYAAECLR